MYKTQLALTCLNQCLPVKFIECILFCQLCPPRWLCAEGEKQWRLVLWWYQHFHGVCSGNDLGPTEQNKRKFPNHFQGLEAEEQMSFGCPKVCHMAQPCYHCRNPKSTAQQMSSGCPNICHMAQQCYHCRNPKSTAQGGLEGKDYFPESGFKNVAPHLIKGMCDN